MLLAVNQTRHTLLIGAVCASMVPGLGCSTVQSLDLDNQGVCDDAGVSILSPSPGIELTPANDESEEPGHQATVLLATELAPDTSVVLVVGTGGDRYYGWPAASKVNASGQAAFEGVTLPNGTITLRVHQEGCTEIAAENVVEVAGPGLCVGELLPRPRHDLNFGGAGVINRAHDQDSAKDGAQVGYRITTGSGFLTALHVFDQDTGSEQIIRGSTDSGKHYVNLDLTSSSYTIWAICESSQGQVRASSAVQAVRVDVIAPTCHLSAPSPQSVVDGSMDTSKELQATQFPVHAEIGGDDVQGEHARIRVVTADGTYVSRAQPIQNNAAVLSGMLWARGAVTIVLEARDHADNRCSSSAGIDYRP